MTRLYGYLASKARRAVSLCYGECRGGFLGNEPNRRHRHSVHAQFTRINTDRNPKICPVFSHLMERTTACQICVIADCWGKRCLFERYGRSKYGYHVR
jgi:hypothetical protein